MTHRRNGAAIALAVMMTAAPAVAGADVKAGSDAWTRGDFAGAVAQWRGPAIAGDADAQFDMGQAYKLGRGVPQDLKTAEDWYRKAALQHHPLAEDNYGLMLFQNGKKGDALPWLEKSVGRDEKRAELVLGTMLFNGDAVPKDWTRAYALVTRASQQGLSQASQTLTQMDGFIQPDQRQKGLSLARQYATQAKLAQTASGGDSNRLTIAEGPAAERASPPARRTGIRPMAPVPVRPTPPPPVPIDRTPPKVAPTPSPTGKWRIQLGAFRGDGNAQMEWNRVRGRLSGAEPFYVHAGAVTRLQAGPYPSKAAAGRACASVGTACLVVAP